MRPLKLRVQGLRSYRGLQEIDFTDKGLVAIVGDTGAGKSSLLEALCMGLYGTCTWSQRDVSALVSTGAATLMVELTFRAEQKEWKVTRSKSHGNYPTPIHKLECSDGRVFDGMRDVNERVEALVGLDYSQFLRAVLIPQGRFQALLQASRAERTAILKGIFRLDVLDQVRESASQLVDELRPRIAVLKGRRSALPNDPTSALQGAKKTSKKAESRKRKLEQADGRWHRAQKREEELDDKAAALVQARSELDPDALSAVAADFRAVAGVQKNLEAESAAQEAERKKIESEIETIEAQQQAAEDAGLGPSSLGAAKNTLESTAAALTQREGDLKDLDTRSKELKSRRLAMSRNEKALSALGNKAQKARGDAEVAEKAWQAAQQRFDEARRYLKELRAAVRRSSEAEKEEKKGAEARDEGVRRLSRTTEALEKAEAHLAKVQIEFETAQKREAAALAAHDCVPGDPCPVCQRDLPETWAAPDGSGTEKIRVSRDAAGRGRDKCLASRSSAESDAKNFKASASKLHRGAQKARSATEDAQKQLLTLVSRFDASLPDDEILEALADDTGKAEAAHGKAHREASDLQEREHRETVGLESARTALEKDSERCDRDHQTLEADEAERREVLGGLPKEVRPTKPYSVESVRAALSRVEKYLGAWAKLEEAHAEQREQLRECNRLGTDLLQRADREVKQPLADAKSSLTTFRLGTSRLAKALRKKGPSGLPAKASADDLVELAESLQASLRQHLAVCEELEEKISSQLADLGEKKGELLNDLGFESAAELESEILNASVATLKASKEVEEAESHTSLAEDLDGRLGQIGPLLDALEETRRLLADSKFVGWLVGQKQRALLVAASKLLGGMTNDRYGFAEDFEIVDRIAGQARDTKTLSGGETFLASLSLALGLAEIASRSGGRLEALFLDEGFASLDANVLTEALDALAKQADSGRLVGVISHLRSVAENISDVLYVTRGPSGSEVHWLSPEERGAMVEDEAEAGLIA